MQTKTPKTCDLVTLKFNRVLEFVKVYDEAKFYRANCSGVRKRFCPILHCWKSGSGCGCRSRLPPKMCALYDGPRYMFMHNFI